MAMSSVGLVKLRRSAVAIFFWIAVVHIKQQEIKKAEQAGCGKSEAPAKVKKEKAI